MEYRDLLAPVQSKPYKESEECRKKGHLMSAECLDPDCPFVWCETCNIYYEDETTK